VQRLFERSLKGLDLPHAHAQVLLCLLREGEMRAVDLAQRTGHDPSTVGRLLGELSKRRMVKYRPDPADGRGTLFRPAARGEGVRIELEKIRDRINDRLRAPVTKADLEAFFRVLQSIDRLP